LVRARSICERHTPRAQEHQAIASTELMVTGMRPVQLHFGQAGGSGFRFLGFIALWNKAPQHREKPDYGNGAGYHCNRLYFRPQRKLRIGEGYCNRNREEPTALAEQFNSEFHLPSPIPECCPGR
jgi:hypothetical protein